MSNVCRLRRAVFLLLALLGAVPLARAGTFSTTPWTNDASSYIASGQTVWAYHFGSTATAAVNGVTVTGLDGPTASNANFDLAGTQFLYGVDHANNLTALGGTGSAEMARRFVYGGNPATITLKGLTAGQAYTASVFGVGFEGAGARIVSFSNAGSTSLNVDESLYSSSNGIRVDHSFVATAATQAITLTPNNVAYTWHLYGLALRPESAPTTVTNVNNSGPGSLRWALANAADRAGPDTIAFAPTLSGQSITLTSGEIVIGGDVTIDATSLPGGVTVSGGGNSRIFRMSSGQTVSLQNLTLTGGNGIGGVGSPVYGGAIFNIGGTVTLTRCTLFGNSSGLGGAIYTNSGSLTLRHCTLTGNSANNYGGAIANTSPLTLTHCTLSGNSANNYGGAIYNNTATLTLTNSIVTGNTAGVGGPDIYKFTGTVTASGANFVGDPASSSLAASATLLTTAQNGAIQLAPLAGNGGPTQTMALLSGSPALDAAVGSSEITDQRGFDRNRDGNAVAGAVPDLGAYEAQAVPTVGNPNPIVVTTATDELDANGTLGTGVSLREAVRDAPAGATITFDASLSGATIALGSAVVIGKNLTIDASILPGGVTLSGNYANEIFAVNSGATVTLAKLTLTGGYTDYDGGAIFNAGTLTLIGCTLSDNHTGTLGGFGGGAIVNYEGTLTLTQCTLSGNSAANYGGAISNTVGTLTLTHCTLSGNSASLFGGAFYNHNGTLTLTNSIVAGNSATNGGPDIGKFVGTVTASGANFVGDVSDSGLAASATLLTTAQNGAIQLGPLANNGGPTKTMALFAGSPALNAAVGSSITSDQRGFPIAGTPDIGAFEVQATISIADRSINEGNTGTASATFTVTLSAASTQTVTVNYATANGTAQSAAPVDYGARTGTLTFSPGQTSKTITVPVVGDTRDEADETFVVNLSGAVNANISDGQGQCTIADDDVAPSLSINDRTVTEGNAGNVNMVFTVRLSAASGRTVTVNYATANGTAQSGAPVDYGARNGTLTFAPGQTSKTITIPVVGDTRVETNETFFVNLSVATNATIADGQGLGTINDDDLAPTLTINDITKVEGSSGGNSNAVFTVTLSEVSGRAVTVNFTTVNGTATAGSLGDYTTTTGTLTIPAGQLTGTITVPVVGDTTVESAETFKINLSGASGANIGDNQGTCTISNDDAAALLAPFEDEPSE